MMQESFKKNTMLNCAAAVLVLIAVLPAAMAQTAQTVSISVKMVRESSGEPLKDGSRTIAWLVPIEPEPRNIAGNDKHYTMTQRNKHFEPNLLVIPVGSSVDFPNYDPWFHNVFSLYRGKRFDLGLYQAGSTRSVRFDRLGVSYLFCNIHPEMNAVIITVESDYFGTSKKNGHIEIRDVPPGKYVMHLWHEQASSESLDALKRTIVVGETNQAFGHITIAVREKSVKHKNKYGQDYDPDFTTPDY
jgi:plastocyanin